MIDYIIQFGDLETHLEYALRPASESLEVRPFVYVLQAKFNSTKNDIVEILADAKQPAMIILMGFFPTIEDLRKEVDKTPYEFSMLSDTYDDEEFGYPVIGVGRELMVPSIDETQVAEGLTIKQWEFPQEWERSTAPLRMKGGIVKTLGKGNTGMLDTRWLTINVYAAAKAENVQPEDIKALPYLTSGKVILINSQILKTDPNAPFTVWQRKGSKKAKLSVV